MLNKPVLVKDKNYYRDRTWNNPYNMCPKIFNLFHRNNVEKDIKYDEE